MSKGIVTELNLQKGDTLLIIVPVGNVPPAKRYIDSIRESLIGVFPNNYVSVYGSESTENGTIQFVKITQDLTDEERKEFINDIKLARAEAKIKGELNGV